VQRGVGRSVRSVITTLTAIVVLVFGAAFGAATSAPARPADRPGPSGAGSQPLPGYTIANPPLTPLTAGGAPTTVTQGVYEHAAFDLEVPAHWNGQLVMWAHGYRGEGTVLTVDPPNYGLRQTLVDEGYAWAASSYTDNGYDVRSGVISEHDLAQHVGALLHRRPVRTYIVGVSMGGQVIGRSLEQYPDFYAGALPMCGVLGDDRLFDFFTDYNLVAQDLAGVRAYPFPDDYQTTAVPTIESKLGIDHLARGQSPTNPLGQQLQAITVQQSGGPRPGADASFSIWKDFLFSLGKPDNGGTLAQNPGRVAQNVLTRYTPNSPVDVNRTVQRVVPTDLRSRLTLDLTQIPRIVGDPRVPVLTLHGLGDMFVPFSMEEAYAQRVAWHGESNLLVQRAVREAGHCEYTPVEVGQAWADLQKWVESRAHHGQPVARPAGDVVTDPRVVAAPTYGCRFTDQTAYADPTHFPTRALFAPCATTG
jgi:pimeloyl-ACP methyl ester carboxylesterase